MPSKSAAQHRLMEGVAHDPAFARKVGIPKNVGEEYVRADASDCKAAGTLYLAGDEVLLMRRGQGASDAAGQWSLPAGHREDGETALDAANRESAEETGFYPAGSKVFSRTQDFVTFVNYLKEKFEPIKNEEHDAYGWFPLSDLPTPLHPGLKASLGRDTSAYDLKSFARGLKEWAAAQDEEPEEDPNQVDKFAWSPDQIKIIHEGTEEAPEPEAEIDEIEEEEVKPTLELDITA